MPSLTTFAVDQAGRITAGDKTGKLRQWDLEKGTVRDYGGSSGAVRFLRYYPHGKLLAVEDEGNGARSGRLRIIDFAALAFQSISLPPGEAVKGITVYRDGRIIAATPGTADKAGSRGKSLLILSPGAASCSLLALSGHPGGTKDCLTMGPKIITCGADAAGGPSLRIWGSEFFVRTELSKLFIKA
jgi:WD40 repeat protein